MRYRNIVAKLVISEETEQARLLEAIRNKDKSAFLDLLRENRHIVNTKIEGHPLLTAAYLYDAEDIIFILLHNGADPTVVGSDGQSFIDYVINSRRSHAKTWVRMLNDMGYKIETDDETHSPIREKFDFEGFKVINAGLRDHELEKVLGPISTMCRKMRKLGFGKLLYGPLIITANNLHGQVFSEKAKQYQHVDAAALYDISKDLVIVNADHFMKNIQANLRYFAHELGHRQWYRYMDASQRQLWTGKFEERSDVIDRSLLDYIWQLVKKATPYKTDHLGFAYYGWDEFDYTKFNTMVQSKQEKYRLIDVLNTAATHGKPVDNEANMKTVRRKFVMEDLLEEGSHGSAMWAAKKIDTLSAVIKGDLNLTNLQDQPALRRLIENDDTGGNKEYGYMKDAVRTKEPTPNQLLFVAGKPRQDPVSSTEYGKTNSSEDYAEAFGSFMANHAMPKELYEQFVRINNLKLAKRKTTCPAKNSPKNAHS